MISRNKRRKLIYLAYCVCAVEYPECSIEQDILKRRYPDTNYGLYVSGKVNQLIKLKSKLKEAFGKRGYDIYSLRIVSFMGTDEKKLEVSGFYPCTPARPLIGLGHGMDKQPKLDN